MTYLKLYITLSRSVSETNISMTFLVTELSCIIGPLGNLWPFLKVRLHQNYEL